ncbi:thioredoxin-like protein [Aureobasidium pullulans]|uniref:Thioredoxin-like protein n=1 Tax=Aureobasidium pullulans TaxID=5580 RepID=A0A4T0BKF5_AURPU|nr:thioredoxin-like protein [Aureobasidium pullulans]TIA32504.1 thioredoxin-like protein [Aureobasidium pullulans]
MSLPTDDGACDHLKGMKMPPLSLPATNDSLVKISSLQGLVVIFCYPRTGAPNETIPDSWNSIPGARGCTPQACSFRDLSRQFLTAGVNKIFGLSTQDTSYQQEVKTRLNLPFELLSDEKLDFVEALKLPTIDWEGKKLTKRITLAIADGKIVKIWYPVFPPDQSAQQVLDWLAEEQTNEQKFVGNRRMSVT